MSLKKFSPLQILQEQEFESIATFYLDHFADSGGAYYITLDQISSILINFDITTDDASNTDRVNLDVEPMTLIAIVGLAQFARNLAETMPFHKIPTLEK